MSASPGFRVICERLNAYRLIGFRLIQRKAKMRRDMVYQQVKNKIFGSTEKLQQCINSPVLLAVFTSIFIPITTAEDIFII